MFAPPSSLMSPEGKPLTGSLLREMALEFPRFRIVEKQHSFVSHLIHYLLLALSFGRQNRFLSEYHTVLGDTLLVSLQWQRMNDAQCYILLRHERIHLRQRRRLTFLGLAFVYLLPFFPIGLAYGRARLEWEAYVETLRATAEVYGMDAAAAPELRDFILKRFTGPDYLWMWPFRQQLLRWYALALREIENAGTDLPLDWPANQAPNQDRSA